MLVANVNSIATLRDMAELKKLEEWQIDDAKRLAILFSEKNSLSQADFGDKFGIGSQGMVWQYLNARRPLNIAVAVNFARGMGVSIDEFSPTIARQIRTAHGHTSSANEASWPFETLTIQDISRLDQAQRREIEGILRAELRRIEERDTPGKISATS